ncbi:unnamed protein product [Pylaiella littoralis]
MSTLRTTRILAAGKTLRQPTPEDRLQRKMAARAATAARTQPTRSSGTTAAKKIPPPAATVLSTSASRSRSLAAPMIAVKRDGAAVAPANIGVRIAAAAAAATVSTESGGKIGAVQPRESDAGTRDGGAATDTSGGASVNDTNCNNSDPEGHNSGAGDRPPQQEGFTSAASHPGNTTDTPNATSVGGTDSGRTAHRRLNSSIGGNHRSGSGAAGKAHLSPSRTRTIESDDDDGNGLRLPPQRTHPHDRWVREGPMRDVLSALFTSTVMGEDGGRVLAPTFPSISALRELKYTGSVGPVQASALGRVLIARPGVLVHLSLPGKRIGDEGARTLAPALAGIQSVDLRSNCIGDVGTIAIASALRESAAAAAAAAIVCGDEGKLLRERRTKSLCILEHISLAANRIGDAGVVALSDMLEEKDEKEEGGERRKDGRKGERHAAAAVYLGWLSVAGNPGISDDARQRLLRAGSNRRLLRGAGGGENNPPPMVIIA